MKHMTYREEQLTKEVKELQFKLNSINTPGVEVKAIFIDSILFKAIESFEFQEGYNKLDLLHAFKYANIEYHLEIKASIHIWKDGGTEEFFKLDMKIFRDDNEDELHASYDDDKFDKWFKGYIKELFEE